MSARKKQLLFNLQKVERQWKKACFFLAQGRVLQHSLWRPWLLSQPFCCCYSGLAAVAFFPEHQVLRVRVTDPSSQGMEDYLLEATSKGQRCQLLLPLSRFWYAALWLEGGWRGRAFLVGSVPEIPQHLGNFSWAVWLAVMHPVIACGGGVVLFFLLVDRFQFYSVLLERTLGL